MHYLHTKENARCYCIGLRRASNVVTSYYDKMLAPSLLTVSQYSILNNLFHIAPCTVSDLAKKLRIERTTLIRNLKPLKALGYVEDLSLPGKRNCQLQITETGLEHYRQAVPLWQQAQATLQQEIGLDTLTHLNEVLQQLAGL
ncbi:MarR family winged helix-turn-helix transcriptional regulator [Ruminococcaceae bacterium OttesenSCG-928-O06]|nr:MarR family winged helix-turn-helix transcriptional regulator [Ruminococcaceae bacterium OttesenSCG-928-O06]